MSRVFSRSQSARALSIDDSFHRERRQHQQQQQQPQQRRWGANLRSRSSRKLVRSNSLSSDYARAAGTMPPSRSASASKQRGSGKGSGKGKQMLRSVVGFLSRTKSGKANKPGSFTMTEPASPSSQSSLSRTNSDDSSAHGTARESGSLRIGAGGPGSASRPRVSFDSVVQTVYIEQMKEEEVRATFYGRTEYAAFKEAYRTHRDTSTDWCRGNDVLPCNCDACQDDLVEGGHNGHHVYSSPPPPVAPITLSPDGTNYDDAFEAPPPPPSPYALGHKAKSERGEGEQEEEEEEPTSPYAYGHKGAAGGGVQGLNAPPSPVGAVFQDIREDGSARASVSASASCYSGSSSSSSSGSACSRRSRSSTRSSRSCPSSSRHSSARRQAAARKQRGTWGVGSVPIASPVRRAHSRGGGLDDWGVSSNVQEAVKCHGEGYAYKTLRLQGFSDLYIRTHFLPEG